MSAPPGRIKSRPEDFVVEELPAYEPSGSGSHVFVRFTKTDLTTFDAVKHIAKALGCDPRAAGFAGMKDKRAVTTQTVSVEAPRGVRSEELAERARSLSLEGLVVLSATPHGNKLKPGHLAGNRFAIVVRGLPADRVGEVTAALHRVAAEGAPNAFGAQRFGRDGDNAERALAWLRGGAGATDRGPRDPRTRRFLWSALQSKVFNAVLSARVEDGTWATPLEGDLLKLRVSGGLFPCSDVESDRARAASGEVSPTGPIVGDRMRWPEGTPARLERAVADAILGAGFDLSSTRRLGEGSRRALRLWVEGLSCNTVADGVPVSNTLLDAGHQAACLRVCFMLPKGAYATTVLSAVLDVGRQVSGSAGAWSETEDAPRSEEEEVEGA
jgi:tRNA pseudouridine13 synthase